MLWVNDQTLSWIIACCNPISALLVGPAVSPKYKNLGWLVLGVSQISFLLFGFSSPYPAFRIAQPCMIPVAIFNYFIGQMYVKTNIMPKM